MLRHAGECERAGVRDRERGRLPEMAGAGYPTPTARATCARPTREGTVAVAGGATARNGTARADRPAAEPEAPLPAATETVSTGSFFTETALSQGGRLGTHCGPTAGRGRAAQRPNLKHRRAWRRQPLRCREAPEAAAVRTGVLRAFLWPESDTDADLRRRRPQLGLSPHSASPSSRLPAAPALTTTAVPGADRPWWHRRLQHRRPPGPGGLQGGPATAAAGPKLSD